MIARCFVVLIILILVFMPRPALAQANTTTLTVQIITTDDPAQPVAEARVTILNASSGQQLAEATTDAQGTAKLGAVPSTEARVVVTGTHPGGATLHLLGQDAGGIWVRLGAAAWTMTLRADVDGAVFPDLSSASAGAPDADAVTVLAGGVGPTVSMPTAIGGQLAPTPVVAQAPTIPVADAPFLPATEPRSTWRTVLLVVLMLCVAGIVLLGGKA